MMKLCIPDTIYSAEKATFSHQSLHKLSVNCAFNLRRYPFGRQLCEFRIMLKKVPISGLLKKTYPLMLKEGEENANLNQENDVKFQGKFGDYEIVRVTRMIENEQYIKVTIEIRSLYDYQVFSGILTSFSVLVIAYSTLFFPLSNFGERIAVSLTTLLVLASIFHQASENVVMTSYLKLLDVWFVVLITFNFGIVIATVSVNRYSTLTRNGDMTWCTPTRIAANKNKSRATDVNKYFRVFFASAFTAFLIWFWLAAGGNTPMENYT